MSAKSNSPMPSAWRNRSACTCRTNGTAKVDEAKIETLVREIFPLTPQGIINYLELRRPIFQKTAAGGHFGRSEPEFSWEQTNKAAALREAVGLGSEIPEPQFVVSG